MSSLSLETFYFVIHPQISRPDHIYFILKFLKFIYEAGIGHCIPSIYLSIFLFLF